MAGNVIKSLTSSETPQKRLYNVKHDGAYIFASFMQAYKIDLIEEIGKLHWKNSTHYLSVWPEGTKFVVSEDSLLRTTKRRQSGIHREDARITKNTVYQTTKTTNSEDDEYVIAAYQRGGILRQMESCHPG